MDPGAGVSTPGSASKGRGRRAAGPRAAGAGRGAGGRGGGDPSPTKTGPPGGSGPSNAAAAGASGATAAASTNLGPAGGGVVKKRGRPAKTKQATDAQAGGDSGAEEPPDTSMPYRGTFTKDLSRLMYGFGDYENPIQETINVVEDILVEYVRETCCSALNEAARIGKLERDRHSGAPKLKVDEKDILFLVRKDPKKYSRIRELLDMQILIKEARKTLDVDKISEGDMDAGAAGG
ncbi:hypothetical protein Agub_g2412, partial [Astrephomene gubernaculifera]